MRRFGLVFAAAASLTACTPPAPPPPAAPQPISQAESQEMGAYGHAMIYKLQTDPQLQALLAQNGITHEFGVILLVDPNGYVEKGLMVKNTLPTPVATAVLNYLINVNFGNFPPDMPQRQMTMVIPVKPQAQ